MDKEKTLPVSPLSLTAGDDQASSDARDLDDQVTRLFREHAADLHRFLTVRYAGDASDDDVKDVVQDAFLRFHEALAGGEHVDIPIAWLLTASRRLMLDRLKARRRSTAKYLEAARVVGRLYRRPSHETVLMERERTEALRRALCVLSPLEKQVLRARAQGLTLRQIGALVGIDDVRRVSETIMTAVDILKERCRD